MSIPNTPSAQFFPSASFRITDPVVYAQIAAAYGFGTNIIYGVSPTTLAATYGANYVDNPTTADYGNLPCIFTNTATSTVQGNVVSSALNGVQTMNGVSYTDANGQLFTSVTWEWAVEVQLFAIADSGRFTTEIIQYTGTGVANRAVATSTDLSAGRTAIMIFPPTANPAPVLATSEMITRGKFATWACDGQRTDSGVVSIGSTGFHVTDNAGQNVRVNVVGLVYTAVIFNDTGTGANQKMAVGTYTGTSPTPLAVSTGLPANITSLFVTGRSGQLVYVDTDNMPAGNAYPTASDEASTLTNLITSVSGAGFTTGTNDANTNGAGTAYAWVAFAISSTDPIRNQFQTFSKTGTGSTVHVTGLGFTPVFAMARQGTTGIPVSVYRLPSDASTTSHSVTAGGATTTGIVSFASGDIGLGNTVAPNGVTAYGWAVASVSLLVFPTPTWVSETTVTNADGTTSTIQSSTQSQTQPATPASGSPYTLVTDSSPDAAQWWCNAALGTSIFQLESPGSGYVTCVGPATKNGWYLSTLGFGGTDIVVSGGKPANPRAWVDIVGWATANTGMLGGSPQAAAFIDNVMVYPGTSYTVGTSYPPIRIFNGRADRELCRLPPTTANVVPKAVISMLVANGTVYLTTWDSGTTSADWAGRVFELDVTTGELTSLGTVFAAGEMPYALAWHMGRLWCGTNNGIGTVGKVYFFRPGIDTAWTQDYATSTSSAGGVDSMVSYKGKLYVGTDNAAASRGKVLVRDTAGAYTTSQTGSGGTAVVNNGYLALTVFGDNLYASYWNNDTTAISKIEKYTGSAWSTAYTGVSGTIRPFIVLCVDNGVLYAVGGGKLLAAALLSTADGTVWSSLAATLPETDTTLLPMFGPVVV